MLAMASPLDTVAESRNYPNPPGLQRVGIVVLVVLLLELACHVCELVLF
jgi:hypothetical protein